MLPQKRRMTRDDLKMVRGGIIQFEYGTLRIVTSSFPKGAVIVSKKRFKTAVARHRAKRRVYAILESLLPRVSGKSIVAYPNPNILTAPHARIAHSFERALTRGA